MLAIYLRPDRTQVLKAKVKPKKGELEIVLRESLPPYAEDIRRSDIHRIIEMFLKVKSLVSTKGEEIYLILPDHLFAKIDCFDIVSSERLLEDIESVMKLSVQNLCIAYPIDVQTATMRKKTACIFEQDLMNVILAAAKEADVTLVSVEPASMAYLRSIGDWKKEKFIFFNHDDTASITSYSPIAGFYSYILMQNIAPVELERNPAAVDAAINEILIKSDNINQATFGMANPDSIEVHLLRAPERYKILPVLEGRLADAVKLPDTIKHDIVQEEQADWMIPVGALLQELPGVYNGAAEFMHFAPGNVVPDEARTRSRFEQLRKTMKKYSRGAIVAACVLLVAEFSAIAYYSLVHIPDNLQQEYTRAQKELNKIEKELKLIAQCKKENQYPMMALNTLVSKKPQGLGFSMIEIGAKNSGMSKNNKKVKWIEFTAKTADPMLFQDFTARLSEQPIFDGASIHQISSDSNSVKSARIVVWKGKVK